MAILSARGGRGYLRGQNVVSLGIAMLNLKSLWNTLEMKAQTSAERHGWWSELGFTNGLLLDETLRLSENV